MSAVGVKAPTASTSGKVRFVPEADICGYSTAGRIVCVEPPLLEWWGD